MKDLKKNTLFYLTLAIILACLFVFSFFSTSTFLEEITKTFFFLFFIPFLHIKYILKKNLADFGFNLKNKKNGFSLSLITLIISLGIIYLFIHFTSFSEKYTLPAPISANFGFFVLYELVFFNILLFFQEFFFKGFTLNATKGKWLYFSILFQAIIYLVPLSFAVSEIWSIIPITITSLLGGIVSYKTKSFIYSYFYSLLFFIIMDAYLIFYQKNIF